MSIEIIDAAGNLLHVKIRGMLTGADYARITQIAREAIAREGKIRALAVLDAFEGWERRTDWGDVSFITTEGRHIEKMAIVGDERWRDEALAFTAQGFRPTAIEFFAGARMNDARAWLQS